MYTVNFLTASWFAEVDIHVLKIDCVLGAMTDRLTFFKGVDIVAPPLQTSMKGKRAAGVS